jgi:hypothetical protein
VRNPNTTQTGNFKIETRKGDSAQIDEKSDILGVVLNGDIPTAGPLGLKSVIYEPNNFGSFAYVTFNFESTNR